MSATTQLRLFLILSTLLSSAAAQSEPYTGISSGGVAGIVLSLFLLGTILLVILLVQYGFMTCAGLLINSIHNWTNPNNRNNHVHTHVHIHDLERGTPMQMQPPPPYPYPAPVHLQK